MGKRLLLFIVGLAFLFSCIYTVQAQERFFSYQRTAGAEQWDLNFTMSTKADQIMTKIIDDNKEETFTYDLNFATLSIEVVEPKEGTDLKISRVRNLLQIRGTVNGKKIEKDLEIDEKLWYQNFEFCLAGFARSKATETKFLVLNKEIFSVNTMSARKKGMEEIVINGETIKAQKVELRLTGFLSLFWKAECWYGTIDAAGSEPIFLMYKGTTGPGTPETVIVLKKVEE